MTRTAPWELDDPDRPIEYEAAAEVESALQPPSGGEQVNVTYNGVQFDDEMIRTMLFRTLRYPWFSSGSRIRRVDMLPLIRLAAAVEPGVVSVPVNQDGGPSWRLEHVSIANGIPIDAHDALGDAQATLDLARLIHDRAPWAWDLALRNGAAKEVESLLRDRLDDGRPVWLFTHFGRPDMVPSLVLAGDGMRRWLLLDLRRADESLPNDAEAIGRSLYASNSPFRVIRSNATPMIVSEAEVQRIGSSERGTIERTASRIKDRGVLGPLAGRALRDHKFENGGPRTSEERLFEGFPGDADKRRMLEFHSARSWGERAGIRFQDRRLRDFAGRIVLEAVLTRRAIGVPEDLIEAARLGCGSVFDRPYAVRDSRWMTLERARDDGIGADWGEWIGRSFRGIGCLPATLRPDQIGVPEEPQGTLGL